MSRSSSKLVYVCYCASADPAVRNSFHASAVKFSRMYGKVFTHVRKSFHASAEKFSRMRVTVFTHVRNSFHACVEKVSRNCEKFFTQVRESFVFLLRIIFSTN